MGFDMFSFKIIGGYQTFEVENAAGDFDVDSWVVGADVGVNFGPGYVKGAISYSQNPGDAGWHIDGLYTDGASASIVGVDNDEEDVDTLMWAVVAGWKFTDMVSLEAGFGWREDDPDVAGGQEDEAWVAYVQLPLRLAPGVAVIPEFGYFDFEESSVEGPSDDQGEQWYLGAKWQIDF